MNSIIFFIILIAVSIIGFIISIRAINKRIKGDLEEKMKIEEILGAGIPMSEDILKDKLNSKSPKDKVIVRVEQITNLLKEEYSLSRAKALEDVEKLIDELEWWTPHCDFCMNQKLVVKSEDLKEKIKELNSQGNSLEKGQYKSDAPTSLLPPLKSDTEGKENSLDQNQKDEESVGNYVLLVMLKNTITE